MFECQQTRVGRGKNTHSKAFTIKVHHGCCFVGDFVHAGANNVQKLKNKRLCNSMLEKATKIIKDPKKELQNQNLFNVLNGFAELSKVTRLFVKNFNKVYSVPLNTVSFPDSVVDEYVDERKKQILC